MKMIFQLLVRITRSSYGRATILHIDGGFDTPLVFERVQWISAGRTARENRTATAIHRFHSDNLLSFLGMHVPSLERRVIVSTDLWFRCIDLTGTTLRCRTKVQDHFCFLYSYHVMLCR